MNVIELARIYNQGVEEGKRQAAQKPWVGLTIGEIQDLIQFKEYSPFALAEAIEAKLREKNGGAA